MSNSLDVTLAYAAAFEETYIDDDWSRLARYFSDDAVYEVIGGPMACRIAGRDAIFAGLKKSLDSLDRRCSNRKIKVTDGPHVTEIEGGGEVVLDWYVAYDYKDAPREGFPGRSIVRVVQGQITSLQDIYDEAEMQAFGVWMQRYGEGLDGRYI